MCKENSNTQPGSESKEVRVVGSLDREWEIAQQEVRLAELRGNAEYNRSPAGQMQRQFETFQRIAKPLSESNFVPANYKGNIGDCIIAVEMAARLGVFPLTVMQNLCIVKGNPTWKSKFLIGCVNTCGRYSTLEYQIKVDGRVGDVTYKTWQKGADNKNREVLRKFERPDLDNLVCVAIATELKTGKVLTSPQVSIRMAIQEGWYSKDGSKWPTMPELMLRYRAASYWVSTYAPEMSMGFRTTEEQADITPDVKDVDYVDLSYEVRPPSTRDTTAKGQSMKEQLRARQQSSSTNKTDDKQ